MNIFISGIPIDEFENGIYKKKFFQMEIENWKLILKFNENNFQ